MEFNKVKFLVWDFLFVVHANRKKRVFLFSLFNILFCDNGYRSNWLVPDIFKQKKEIFQSMRDRKEEETGCNDKPT